MDEKNPFSLYDFLGYFFPGCLALFIIFTICKTNESYCDFVPSDYVNTFMDFLRGTDKLDILKILLPFIVVAYVLGHLISYLSSLIVEYFTTRTFGYPSAFLLHKINGKSRDKFWKDWSTEYNRFECNRFKCLRERPINVFRFFLANRFDVKMYMRMIIFLLLLPVTTLILYGWPVSKPLVNFITRPQDSYTVNCIEKNLYALASKINIDKPPINLDLDFDYHRIVMHYVYLHYPACQKKADNYVALYGFLRCTTLILCLFTDFIAFMGIISILHAISDRCICISWSSIILIVCLWTSSIVSYLGYVKFYRRFTLENYMTLLAEGDRDKVKKMQNKESN